MDLPGNDELPSFYEFFAGGGMVRLGLGKDWNCVFANDSNSIKAAAYRSNFHANGELVIGDVANVTLRELPNVADLAWASFPCQDLSQAGAGRGLNGRQSGAFWPFWRLMERLCRRSRAPKLIVIENVCGALSSRGGKDFQEISNAFSKLNYTFGALVVDARHFVPQSRPRLFIIGVNSQLDLPSRLTRKNPSSLWHPQPLQNAHKQLCTEAQRRWVWWHLPHPPNLERSLDDLIERDNYVAPCDKAAETRKLMTLISPSHKLRLREANRKDQQLIATLYRRMRPSSNGQKVQRAEIRIDGLAGCLRTPSGGSSRQTVLIADGTSISSRKVTPREAARLMGIPETYELPEDPYDAYRLVADGVAVPVVQFLNNHLFLPALHKRQNATIKLKAIRNHAPRKVARYQS